MPRTSRFVLLAVLALVGGIALIGCGRAQPGTAAYVGSTRYTELQVEAMMDEIRAAKPVDAFTDRQMVVSWLVMGNLARRAAAERSIMVPPAEYAVAARALNDRLQAQNGVDPKLTVVRVLADWIAARDALAGAVEPVTPSEDELREIYQILRAAGQLPSGVVYEQVAERLRAGPELPIEIGVRNVLRDTANKSDVVVGPRYRPLVGYILTVPVVLAEDSTTVTDLNRT